MRIRLHLYFQKNKGGEKLALFVIGDLHLSLSSQKPMDIFGSRWENYISKIEAGWKNVVSESDTVIVAGDVSWAMTTEESKPDFDFIEALPGKKILLKGNHDYWWQTQAKLDKFLVSNGYKTISFLHNNAYICEDFIVCGSRGWYDESKDNLMKNASNTKIIAREVQRIKISLDAGCALEDAEHPREKLMFMHFPAIFKGYMCDEIIAVLYRYGIERCFYGHIHGNYEAREVINYADIDFRLISADYINFIPFKIEPKKQNNS